jgi:hypothetical protein
MAICESTRAVFNGLVADIKKILFWTTIIVQVVFLGFYAYSIYNNIDELYFFITYSILCFLSLVTFINYLVTYNKSSKNIDKFKRFLRVFKYIVNGSMLIVSAYNIITHASSDLSKIILIVSAISWLVQIIIECVRIFIERYVELFKVAFEQDFSFVNKFKKLLNVKEAAIQLVDAPFEAIAKKIEKDEQKPSKEELRVERLEKKIEEKKKQQREEKKHERDESLKKSKGELKEHLGIIAHKIFKKK